MKITHPSGEDYDLFPDTEIELTRYNPFFHELGEQSVPITLPSTSKNLQLLGNPERADNINKPASRLDVHLQSGVFAVKGRQAVLSAQAKGNIDASFYLHEGAFYERIDNVMLSEIFENRVDVFSTPNLMLSALYEIAKGNNDALAIFQIKTDKSTLNELSDTIGTNGMRRFVNDVATERIIDEKKITIPQFFFMTPFIKVRYVLKEVLAFLGYTLGSSFLDMDPFKDMVFLNNNIDTIVDLQLRYIDVVPDISVKTLFDVIRKFNVEFVPDEQEKVVNIVSFDDILSELPKSDLSEYVVSQKVVKYHNNYRQLRLTSNTIDSSMNRLVLAYHDIISSNASFLTSGESEGQGLMLNMIIDKFPTSYYRNIDGAIVRDGFLGVNSFKEKISGLGIGYFDGGNLTVEDKSFPDVMPDVLTSLKITYPDGSTPLYTYTTYPFVGSERALRSKLVLDDNTEQQISFSKLDPMLCLTYNAATHSVGTLANYSSTGVKLWNYNLLWIGEDGIYEKFWRKYDDILRNALLDVEAEVILPQDVKLGVSSVSPVLLHNQKYLLSTLDYSTKKNTVSKCLLKSLKKQYPVKTAGPADKYLRSKQYMWKMVVATGGKIRWRFKATPTAYYPPDPTEAQFNAGGRYYERTYQVEYTYSLINWDNIYEGTITTWLEPALYQ